MISCILAQEKRSWGDRRLTETEDQQQLCALSPKNVADSQLTLDEGHKWKVPSRDKITQNTQTPPTSNLKLPVVSQWIYVGVAAI